MTNQSQYVLYYNIQYHYSYLIVNLKEATYGFGDDIHYIIQKPIYGLVIPEIWELGCNTLEDIINHPNVTIIKKDDSVITPEHLI